MLSERDHIFCEKVASGLMAYQAYIEAGFCCTSNESAQAAASRKMKEPGIKEEFFNDPAPTEIYTLPLHDALPISSPAPSTSSSAPASRRRT